MSWFPIAIIAQIILGTSAVFDKMLLKRSIFNPAAYTFWLGVLGLFAVLIPFRVFGLPVMTIGVALIAGALFLLAMLFLFLSLHKTEASKSLLLIGALRRSPRFLSGHFFRMARSRQRILSVSCFWCLAGSLFYRIKRDTGNVALLACASAVCFGLSNTLTKQVFLESSFTAGFLVKIGGVYSCYRFFASLCAVPYFPRFTAITPPSRIVCF